MKPRSKWRPQTTLKRLRADAPRQDRECAALALPPAPPGYKRYSPFAQTLDELRDRLGRLGEAAVTAARWRALRSWLFEHPPEGLSHDPDAVHDAVALCREEQQFATGLVHVGYYRASPAMGGLSPEAQADARRIAADTVADWERAGSPGLTPDQIKTTHQYVLACFRERGLPLPA